MAFTPGPGKSAAHNKKHGLRSGARSGGVTRDAGRPGRYNGAMFEQAFKNIDDVLWKEAGCTTELDYTEQSSWLHGAKLHRPCRSRSRTMTGNSDE
jgi:hypothetical protein